MILSAFDKIKSAVSYGWESGTRKRSKCRDLDSDDETEIDVLITPKKPRLEIDDGCQNDQPYIQYWHHPLGHVAEWIVKTKNKFHDLFYINTVMNRLKLSFQDKKDTTSFKNEAALEITIDDDDDEEPVVVFDATEKREASHASTTSLLRPPLERKLNTEYAKKRQESGRESQHAMVKSRKKHGFVKPETFKPNPKTCCKKSETSIASNQEYGHCGQRKLYWRGTTAQESIRLAEREKYRQLLEQFSSIPVSPLSEVESSLPDRISCTSPNKLTYDASSNRNKSVLKQKLSNSVKDEMKKKYEKRLHSSPVKANQALPDVIWIHTSSPEIIVVERKMPSSTSQRSSVFKEVASKRVESNECQIVTPLPESNVCKFQTLICDSPYLKENWLSDMRNQFQLRDDINKKLIATQEEKVKQLEAQRDAELKSKLENVLRLTDKTTDVLSQEADAEVLPELTSEMIDKIEGALRPSPPGEVLVDAFKLQITRRDMETLAGLNWLNDEIINFYFNLLMERGKRQNFLSVYSCNTFFYPKLISAGHASLKRWTRKVDIFAHDLMFVPVHLGMHWCLAVVDFRSKKISYYDSMCGQNNQCLQALKSYLEAESLDKKSLKLDTAHWRFETVKDKPNQLNGSDCGMFTCIYAEYISRDAKLSFTQEDMPYFRKRMVYEILTAQLL